jgi:hypothetical protein
MTSLVLMGALVGSVRRPLLVLATAGLAFAVHALLKG